MAKDYYIACFTCKESFLFASGSGFRGFRVFDSALAWLGSGQAVGTHEGHDLRILGADDEPPWECCGCPLPENGVCPICAEVDDD